MSANKSWLWPVVGLGLFGWALAGLNADLSRINRVPSALAQFLGWAFPPDFSSPGVLLDALTETLQMAILATAFGLVLSLPLGLLSARNLFPAVVATPVRLFAAGIRVLPAIIWALIAVIVFGPGSLAGVIALTFYAAGFLAKLQAEAFEGIPRDAIDAVRAMGLGRLTIAWHVALPEAANALRSQGLFMLEYNVRNSSVVGIVGAGGLGIIIQQAWQFFAYDRILAVLLLLYATVVLVDAAGYALRRRFVELAHTPRARWRDLFPNLRTR